MANTVRGRAVVIGADGSVSVAGVAITNAVQSATLTGAATKQLLDSSGKVASIYANEASKTLSVDIQPGGNGVTTGASAATQCALPAFPCTVILGDFSITAYNGTYIGTGGNVKLSSDGVAMLSLECFTGDNIAALAVAAT